MKKWEWSVSSDWLAMRRHVITATEVANLLPEYKRMKKKPGGTISPGCAGIWAEKNSTMDVDPWCVGAAARGHIMEPFAIQEWNRQKEDKFYHWDDCIIMNGGVGFSPDACDIEQQGNEPYAVLNRVDKTVTDSTGTIYGKIKKILEVKSYMPDHHMKSCLEGRKEHKEVMQIASAFIVLPTLEEATILWYCPDAPISMYSETYTREDLADEIELCKKIIEMYKDTAKQCSEMASELKAELTEDQIYAMTMSGNMDTEKKIYMF